MAKARSARVTKAISVGGMMISSTAHDITEDGPSVNLNGTTTCMVCTRQLIARHGYQTKEN